MLIGYQLTNTFLKIRSKGLMCEMKYQIYFLPSTILKADPLFSLKGTSKGYSVTARKSGFGIARLRSDDCSV